MLSMTQPDSASPAGDPPGHQGFGPKPIRSEYEIESSPGADYVACHHTYLGAVPGGSCPGVFLTRSPRSSPGLFDDGFRNDESYMNSWDHRFIVDQYWRYPW